jgi:hypothetical protein
MTFLWHPDSSSGNGIFEHKKQSKAQNLDNFKLKTHLFSANRNALKHQ